MAKQKVALECLSYHATAPQELTVKLASEFIKSSEEYKLYSFKFIGKCRIHTNIVEHFFKITRCQQISSLRKRKHAMQR